MNIDNLRGLKAQISAEVVAAAIVASPDRAAARSFFASTEPPMPRTLALGIAKKENGEFLLAVRTENQELADEITRRARGETDVKIVRASIGLPPNVLQSRVRPVEPGIQLQIAGAGFVGTFGFVARNSRGKLVIVSNSHVIADQGRTPIGTRIHSPFTGPGNEVGVLESFVAFSRVSPNLADVACATLDPGMQVLSTFNSAIAENIKGLHRFDASELGMRVTKVGRTTGVTSGKVTAAEIDGLPIGMDAFTPIFNDFYEVSSGPGAKPFSQPGDSGSLVLTMDGFALMHLNSGGRDGTGEDLTFGGRVENALGPLGLTLVTV